MTKFLVAILVGTSSCLKCSALALITGLAFSVAMRRVPFGDKLVPQETTTRSLVRAKKSLSALPGGGGTPLASGLQSAFLIASEEMRNGRMTSIVLLTDGSANVALDGTGGRAQAMSDAMKVSEMIAANDIPCLLVDVSKLASPKAREISQALGANYLPMPFVSSKNLSDAVRASR